ncbi:efflux transporter outer membrane subunit [Roseomonas marmotae]|uniref:Efflux transporter outer membrane subunit n=1 Tax=Roseomonas marmotae TaxID=2768161 RepID=A0ABS3KGD2_9PROT|nr:efflux transporter outer membrane subunit [Roseomonas marmotae]MBO1076529.1 efflux transporter outer membrane subunit [Roseomonas marmotae]QTI81854.1 efflux transporter outer membrane subunit [Roseomonas marmotae]
MSAAIPRLSGAGAGRKAAISLLAMLALAGCAIRPDATRAGLTIPDRFRQAAAQGEARWPDPDWWRGFNAPELDRLMAQASAGAFDIAAAAARVRQADAQTRIAGSALLPNLSGGLDAARRQNGGGNRRSTAYDASLAASYEIDFWGLNRNNAEAARLAAQGSRFDAVTVMLTTQASLANTYFDILTTREQLRVQEENLEAARRILSIIRSQVAAGIATGLDLAQQETLVAQQEAQLPALRQRIAQSINALGVLLGRPPQEIDVLPGGLERIRVPEPAPGLPGELLARRPDVWSAEAQLAAANADVAAARAALLPSVTVSAQGGFSSAVLGTLLRPEAQFWSLATGLTQTIFDNGARQGRIELTQAQAEELVVEYRRAIVSALSDVEDALVALRETTEQERLQAAAAERAGRAASIAEAQLRAGTINLITLLNTQQSLFSARNNLVQARLARLQAAVGLFRALGGGWQPGRPAPL